MADNFVTVRLLESEISTIRHALSDAAFVLPIGPTQAACSQALGMIAFADACAHAMPVQQCPDTPDNPNRIERRDMWVDPAGLDKH